MAKPATPKNELAPRKENLPAELLEQIALDAGMGSEDATTEDMILPFLKIAQALSPEVNKRESVYIDGLEQGDFFNTASQATYKGESGLYLVPVYFQRKYLEWTPRDAGGGFNGEHPADIMDKTKPGPKGENFLDNGNEIVITGTWYCLVIDGKSGDVLDQAVISLSKTQLKKSRGLMSRLKQVTVTNPATGRKVNTPLFYNVLKVTSVPESNDQGNWYGWKFDLAGNVFQFESGAEIYDGSKVLLEALRSGKARAADPNPSDNLDRGSAGAEGQKPLDDETPF